jgi:hypothetical protein
MKYFLHDTSAIDDEKVTELFMKFGYEGVGLFYVTLEKLAKQEKPVKTNILKAQLKVGKRLEKCWNFMEQIGIISSNNGETFNKQLLNFSESYQIKKEKTREKVKQWRNKQEDTGSVTSYVPVSNLPKVKESKVKESKVKESKYKEEKAEFDFSFVEDPYKEIFLQWIKYKRSRNEMYKTRDSLGACYRNLLALSINDPGEASKIIDQSMGNNWQGLFPLKTNNKPGATDPKMSTKYIKHIKQ